MSQKTVDKHISVLEDVDLIEVSKRGGSTNNIYMLLKLKGEEGTKEITASNANLTRFLQ